MGTWAIGGGAWWGDNDDSLSVKAIQTAVEQGIRWIDTAPIYGLYHLSLIHIYLCDAHGVDFAGRTVLILGTGGTHNTTSAVARDKGAAKVLTVSRHPDPETGELSYAEAVRSGAPVSYTHLDVYKRQG